MNSLSRSFAIAILACIIMAAVAAPSSAHAADHGRPHSGDASRELASALAANARPGLAHEVKSLGFFQGSWSCQGEFPASGRTIASAERFAPVLLGHWLMMHHADRPPFTFQAVEMWRYDAAGKRFENYIFDEGSGIRRYTSPGWEGRRLTWTLASSGQPLDRFEFERKDATHYAVDYSRSTGKQAWTTVDTLHCERRAP